MPVGSNTLYAQLERTRPKNEDVALTPSEAGQLIGICMELIDLCARVTGKIDPAVGTIVGYARDELLSEVFEAGP